MITAIRAILQHKLLPVFLLVASVLLFAMKVKMLGSMTFIWSISLFTLSGISDYLTQLAKGALAEVKGYAIAVIHWIQTQHVKGPQTPLYQLCWVVTVLVVFVTLFSPLSLIESTWIHKEIKLFMGIFTVLGFVELAGRGYALFRLTWARLIGKILWGLSAAVFTCVASGLARQFSFELTGQDPAKFPAFVNLVTVILTPMALWAVLYVISIVWFGAEMLIKMFLYFTPDEPRPSSDNVKDGPVAVQKTIGVFKTIGIVAVLTTLRSFTPSLNPAEHPDIHQIATNALVFLEYWQQPVCDSEQKFVASKIDANHYSVATFNGMRASISTMVCSAKRPLFQASVSGGYPMEPTQQSFE